VDEVLVSLIVVAWLLPFLVAPLVVGWLCRKLTALRRLAIAFAASLPLGGLISMSHAEFGYALSNTIGAAAYIGDNRVVTSGKIRMREDGYYAHLTFDDLDTGEERGRSFALARQPGIRPNAYLIALVLAGLTFGVSSLPARKVPDARSSTIPAP